MERPDPNDQDNGGVSDRVPTSAVPSVSAAAKKSVNLRAFNLYAAKVRQETKDQNPDVLGYDIERLIGKKWAKLSDEEKREFTEQAAKEKPESLGRNAKKKKQKRESRPQDKESLPGLVKPKKRRGELMVDATIGDGSPGAALIGTPVSGLIDGMFDAGYFVTLKVGDRKQPFKGVIFRPDLGASASQRPDIAPKVWTLDTRGASKQPETSGVKALENGRQDGAVVESTGAQEGEGIEAAEMDRQLTVPSSGIATLPAV